MSDFELKFDFENKYAKKFFEKLLSKYEENFLTALTCGALDYSNLSEDEELLREVTKAVLFITAEIWFEPKTPEEKSLVNDLKEFLE